MLDSDTHSMHRSWRSAWQRIGHELGVKMPELAVSAFDTPITVRELAQRANLRVRNVTLTGTWWREASGVLLAFHNGAPIVLTSRRGKYVAYNADVMHIVNEQMARNLDATAYLFYRPLPTHPLRLHNLLGFGVLEIWRPMFVLIVVGIIGGLLGVMLPLASAFIFDHILPNREHDQLLVIGIILVLSAAALALFQIARSIGALQIQTALDQSLSAALWDRLLNLPASFFRRYTAGDLAERLLGISTIKWIFSDVVTLSLLSGVFSIFNFVLLVYYSPALAVVALVLIGLSTIFTILIGRRKLRYERASTTAQGQVTALLIQLVNGIPKLRTSGAEDRAFHLWTELFTQQRIAGMEVRSTQNINHIFATVFPAFASMLIFALWVQQTSRSIGEFIAFNLAFSQLMIAAAQLSSGFLAVVSIIPIYERLKPILEASPESKHIHEEPKPLRGEIELRHVSFRYHANAQWVVQNISIHVRAGEFVGIVGETGSGKSTLVRLLLGFEEPVHGELYYDHIPLTSLNIQGVRRQLGVVLQNTQVAEGDIFTNLDVHSQDDAWQALRLVGLEDDVKAMPLGLFTPVSTATLSGGQRQRLMIARAIIRQPPIVILDEATSSLDAVSQAIIMHNLKQFQATRIVIAHRLSTLRNADQIYVLHNGQLVEHGTFTQLTHAGGYFASWVQRTTTS